MPAHSYLNNPAALTLPDAITDIDLLAPMPDPSLLFSQPLDLGLAPPPIPDWDSSQFLSGSVEQPRAEPEVFEDDDDLDIQLDEDLDIPEPITFDEGTSIERGRDAPLERRASEEFGTDFKDLGDDDLGIQLGADDDLTEMPGAPEINIEDTDMQMGGMTELEPQEPTLAGEPQAEARERSISPLSELGEDETRALELEVQDASIFQPAEEQQQDEEEEVEHQARAKRRRLIQQDTQTQLSSTEIRNQQNNRDNILKPASFLPRDPLLMTLMNMQKSGGFVSSILGDGRSQGWAPELRGILSLEVVSRPSQKRKRDSGIADVETAEEQAAAGAEKTPQLEFEQDEPLLEDVNVDIGGDISLQEEQEILELPDEGVAIPQDEDEEEEAMSPGPIDNFDDTTVPILYPADSGVVSLETKHAVHMLRQVFGDAAETSEEERVNTAVSFQGMFPEDHTTKADVARMFNEVLVLATKDAIKVEQQQKENELGSLIKIRAKRGLWGSWAETDVSGAEAIKAAEAREAAQATQPSATPAEPLPSAEIAVEV
jgi:cohesin complex subunit SCC1